jgi:peptide/nickel transport system permease protein
MRSDASLRHGKTQRKLATPMSKQSAGARAPVSQKIGRHAWVRTLARCFRYLGIRTIVVVLTVFAGVYAAIWVTNLGGFSDESRRAEIRAGVVMGTRGLFTGMSSEEREEALAGMFEAAYEAADLNQPFFLRSFRYFRDAFSLSLGETDWMKTRRGSHVVLDILMERLPITLLLFGIGNTLTFFGGLYIALILSRRYGSVLDRAATLLVPAFAAPPWFHGIFLIVIFAVLAKILPFGGVIGVPYPETTSAYVLSFLRHMILPTTAFVIGTMPAAIYANRALFLIHSSEDYVELASAKGLRPNRLRTRYILRPVLPAIITNFAFVSIVSWQAVILTEHVFNWPGLGTLLIDAIRGEVVPVVTGAVTLFAYLLGFSILFLDIVYVLVDPRVRLGGGRRT